MEREGQEEGKCKEMWKERERDKGREREVV